MTKAEKLIYKAQEPERTTVRYPGRNGRLDLDFGTGWAKVARTIYGGPFRKFDPAETGAFGLCLLETNSAVSDAWLPIEDFSVPKNDAAVNKALRQVVMACLLEQNVYVGCAGGFGRTGLFLAILTKASGQEDPVGYVRKHYTSHAVETPEQRAYVENFDVTDIRKFTSRATWVIWALKKLKVW